MSVYAHAGLFWGVKLPDKIVADIKNRLGMVFWCPKCRKGWKSEDMKFCTQDGTKLELFPGYLHPDTLYGEHNGKAHGCELVGRGLDHCHVFAVVTESAHMLCGDDLKFQVLQPTSLSVGAEWQAALTKFIQGLDVVIDDYPQWYLTCNCY